MGTDIALTKLRRVGQNSRDPDVSRASELKQLRHMERIRLIAQRVSISSTDRVRWNRLISDQVINLLASPAPQVIGGYWPFRGEFDPRTAMHYLHSKGARLALPRVVKREAPLQFLEWRPGAPLIGDLFDVPVPEFAIPLIPKVLLIPVVGIDSNGFRLGYGTGYFDRTLAALTPAPVKIAVGYELSRVATIYPQAHDIPMDFLVTEAGVQSFSRKGRSNNTQIERSESSSPPIGRNCSNENRDY